MRFAPARSIVAFVAAVVGALVLGSASTEAATTAAAAPTVSLKICVVDYQGNSVGAYRPLRLYAWDAGATVFVGSANTGPDGCQTLFLPPNVWFYVDATWTYRNPYMYASGSNLYAEMGSSSWFYLPDTPYTTYQLTIVLQAPKWIG